MAFGVAPRLSKPATGTGARQKQSGCPHAFSLQSKKNRQCMALPVLHQLKKLSA
jgi:hypothetical protein